MLDDASTETLRTHLHRLPEGKPALRLIVALNYKHGIPVTDISSMYGVSERTVYNWIHRIENRPLDEALHDETRPGRPPRLTPGQRSELETVLSGSPMGAGFSAREWTTGLVAEFIEQEYGVEFSLRHTRRLMHDLTRE